MNMDFGTNKTPKKVIKEGASPWTYFRDIYCGIIYYCSNHYDVNKYKVKSGKSLTFCENKGWINSIDPFGWFQ